MISQPSSTDNHIQAIIEKQRLQLEERNKDLINLQQKLKEKDYYLARLEMDLEHAIGQCKQIAASKISTYPQWINRAEPGLEPKY